VIVLGVPAARGRWQRPPGRDALAARLDRIAPITDVMIAALQ